MWPIDPLLQTCQDGCIGQPWRDHLPAFFSRVAHCSFWLSMHFKNRRRLIALLLCTQVNSTRAPILSVTVDGAGVWERHSPWVPCWGQNQSRKFGTCIYRVPGPDSQPQSGRAPVHCCGLPVLRARPGVCQVGGSPSLCWSCSLHH